MKFNFRQEIKKEIYLPYIFLILFILASLSFLFFNINKAQSAIVTNDVSIGSCDCSQLIISNHEISQKKPLLIVGVGLEDGGIDKAVDSITYNGETLTRLAQEVNTTKARTDVWYLKPSNNPPSGQYDVVINLQKNNRVSAGAITFNSIDHSNPIDFSAVQSNSGIGINSSVNVPSNLNDVVMNVVTAEKASIIFDSSQVGVWNTSVGSGNYTTAASTKDGVEGDVLMNAEFSDSKNFSHIGFNINVAPECDDGKDNDGDGQTDYPKDNGCQFPADNDETGPSGGSENVKIKYSGIAYPNGTVTFHMEDENGNTCENIENFTFNTGENGRFNQDFNLCFKEDPILSIQATDSEGRTTILSTLERSFRGSVYYVEDIIFPPTVNFATSSALKGEGIIVSGSATPNNDVEVIIDGTFINSTKVDKQGNWSYKIDTKDFRLGDHSVRARVKGFNQSIFSGISNFYIYGPSLGLSDLNNDLVLDIKDFSLFLFRWNYDGIMRETIDFNSDSNIDIKDFSIFLKSFSE